MRSSSSSQASIQLNLPYSASLIKVSYLVALVILVLFAGYSILAVFQNEHRISPSFGAPVDAIHTLKWLEVFARAFQPVESAASLNVSVGSGLHQYFEDCWKDEHWSRMKEGTLPLLKHFLLILVTRSTVYLNLDD